jgi:hypothetical protein
MSKSRQRNLFEAPETGGNWLERPPLNPRPHLKEDIARTMAASRWGRGQIVDRMNLAYKLAGLPGRMSLAKLDAWAAKSKTALPDLMEAEFFYWAAGSRLPLAGQAERAAACLVSREDQKYLELGKAQQELRRLGKTARRLQQEIEDKG